jgi:hypothetical protein
VGPEAFAVLAVAPFLLYRFLKVARSTTSG